MDDAIGAFDVAPILDNLGGTGDSDFNDTFDRASDFSDASNDFIPDFSSNLFGDGGFTDDTGSDDILHVVCVLVR